MACVEGSSEGLSTFPRVSFFIPRVIPGIILRLISAGIVQEKMFIGFTGRCAHVGRFYFFVQKRTKHTRIGQAGWYDIV